MKFVVALNLGTFFFFFVCHTWEGIFEFALAMSEWECGRPRNSECFLFLIVALVVAVENVDCLIRFILFLNKHQHPSSNPIALLAADWDDELLLYHTGN